MSRRNTLIVIGGVALAVVLAVVVALGGGSADPSSDDGGPAAFAPVEVTGQDLPVHAQGGGDLAVGMEAPTLSGTDLTGDSLTIDPGGDAMVLIFLAHWCPHCQAEVPRLQEWIEETGGPPAGVELAAVATGTDPSAPNFPPGAWLDGEGFSPPVLLDDEQDTAGRAYGVSSYPFWVVIDGQGQVAGRFSGELDRAGIEELFRQVETLAA